MKTASPPRARTSCRVPFGFLSAKLRGRRSALYEGRRLLEVSRERSIGDLGIRLFPREDVRDPLDLERRILSASIRELAFFSVYVGDPYLAFYSSLLQRYAVANLKVLLRTLGQGHPAEGNAGEETAGAGGYEFDLPRFLALPVEALAASESVEEFVKRIPLTHVRERALAALPLYAEGQRKAFLEMGFDKGYWLDVWENLGRLPAGGRGQCWAPLRCEFDAMRLLGTLRAAAVYSIPWEQWEQLVPVGPGRISAGTLRRIYERPEPECVREEVPWVADALERFIQSHETAGASRPGEPLDLGRLEEALWHEGIRLANRQYYGTTSGPAVLVSYFYLKRDELRHLLALAQMIRYGTGEQEIAVYLQE